MKRILVPMLGEAVDRKALDVAALVASSFRSHIEARLFQRDPRDAWPVAGEGFSAAMIEQLMAAAEERSKALSTAGRGTFDAWVKETGLPAPGDGDEPSAGYEEVVGQMPGTLLRPGREADLIVVGRGEGTDPSPDSALALETMVIDSGRPVLIAPVGDCRSVGTKAIVAWNGSAESARAVTSAMPVLAASQSIIVATVDDGDVDAKPDGLVRTLQMHGCNAEARALAMNKEGVAATLEDLASETGADLILIGAYSHSRLREFIFGGVTDDALVQSAVPMMLAR